MKKVLKHLNKVYEGVTVELKAGKTYKAMVFVDGQSILALERKKWKELKKELKSYDLEGIINLVVLKDGLQRGNTIEQFLRVVK